MSQVIAFWNVSPFEKKYYQGQLLATFTIDGDEVTVSPSDSPLKSRVESEGGIEEFVKRYSKYSSVSGIASRLLNEGEEPKDIVYDQYRVRRFVPGKGLVTLKSYTIDEEGVLHKNAKES